MVAAIAGAADTELSTKPARITTAAEIQPVPSDVSREGVCNTAMITPETLNLQIARDITGAIVWCDSDGTQLNRSDLWSKIYLYVRASAMSTRGRFNLLIPVLAVLRYDEQSIIDTVAEAALGYANQPEMIAQSFDEHPLRQALERQKEERIH